MGCIDYVIPAGLHNPFTNPGGLHRLIPALVVITFLSALWACIELISALVVCIHLYQPWWLAYTYRSFGGFHTRTYIVLIGHIPNDWTKGVLIPIYKKGLKMIHQTTVPLLSCFGKVFTAILNSRITCVFRRKWTIIWNGRFITCIYIYQFDKTIVPILTHGCEIWGFENLQNIDKVHVEFLKSILKSNPNCMVYGEYGRCYYFLNDRF